MDDEQEERTIDDVHLTPWDNEGIATIEVTGGDLRSTLASLLRGILALTVPEPAPPTNPAETRAAPIRGEGTNMTALIGDLTEDLLAQIDDAGAGSLAVALDGIVRRDDGGYVAWGYLEMAAEAATRVAAVERQGEPIIEEGAGQVRVRLRLARPQER